MSEIEFIDLFPQENTSSEEPNMDSTNFNSENLASNGGNRIRFNDYKHSSNKIHKGHAVNNRDILNKTDNLGLEYEDNPDKSKLHISDENIVWAGAIFVFFGVLVFLIGYWLGKTTIKSVKLANDQYIDKMEEKLQQQKMEHQFLYSGIQTDGLSASDKETTVSGTTSTVDATPQGEKIVAPPIEKVTAPPIEAQPKKTIDTSTVTKPVEITKPAKTITSETKTKTETKPAKTVIGNFTIQVSAHTSIDKARAIEDQLRSMGYQAYLVESIVNGVRYYRVRVGKFGNKNDASAALSKLKKTSIGKDAYIIKLN